MLQEDLPTLLVIGANTPEPLVVLLATASLGAIFTSLAPDMGEVVCIVHSQNKKIN